MQGHGQAIGNRRRSVAAVQHCENQGCVALVVGARVATAASIIVSGSIVVIGNIAYWLKSKSRCQPES